MRDRSTDYKQGYRDAIEDVLSLLRREKEDTPATAATVDERTGKHPMIIIYSRTVEVN